MNYYPHNVGDYLKKTLGLSLAQDGAYRRAIDWYYDHEGRLPLKPDVYDELRCKGKSDRDAVDMVLAKYFTETPDGYQHERCDEELAKYAAKADTARENGKRGGRPRNPEITNPVSSGLGVGIPEGTQTKANQEPRTSNQEPEVKRVARGRAKSAKTPLPGGFGISPRVVQWASENGHTRLPEHLEHFLGKARANGYRYADWDDAFMNAIRDNWAKLGPQGNGLSAHGNRTAQALSGWINEERNGTDGP